MSNYNIVTGSWDVGIFTPSWWPGMAPGGVSYEDRLVELDGQPYGIDQDPIYATAYARQARSVELLVIRAGEQTTAEVPVVLFSPSNFLDVRLPTAITGLGFWLLAVVIYRAQPTLPLNRLATVAGCLTAIAFWLPFPGLSPHVGWATRVLDFALLVVVFPFLGAVLAHLAFVFPGASCLYRPFVPRILYFVSFCIAIPYGLSRLLLWNDGWSPLVGRLDGFSYHGYLYFLGLGMFLLLVRLAWTALRPGSPRRWRRQSIVVVLGLLAALPAVAMTWLAQLAGGEHSLYWRSLDLRYLYLAIPLAFAFTILRYQTFRNVHPVFLAVLVLFTSSLLASIGAWLVRLTQPQPLDTSLAFLSILAVTLVTSAIWSTQGSWRGVLGRLLHWEVRSYEAVRRFGHKVVGDRAGGDDLHTGRPDLPLAIVEALVSELELECAALWLWEKDEMAFDLAGKASCWRQSLPDRLTPGPALDLAANEPLPTGGEALPDWLAPLQRLTSVEVVVPLVASGRPVGLLALGKRWDEEVFDRRDLGIVALIAQQVALFLLTDVQIQELRRVPRRVANAQERERARIAQELHDTVQQFIGGLPFHLEAIRALVRTDPEQAEAILEDCLADAVSMGQTVREIRDDLAPGQLDADFGQALADLAGRWSHRIGVEVQLDISPGLATHISLATRHALYRVVQQALDNVAAHAQARSVHISLARSEGQVVFGIVDDGRGSSESQRAQAQAQGSVGLQSMEARIRTLGGKFEFVSAPGRGTRVTGWAPLDAKAEGGPAGIEQRWGFSPMKYEGKPSCPSDYR